MTADEMKQVILDALAYMSEEEAAALWAVWKLLKLTRQKLYLN
jgi:hypothetical protein